MNPGDFDHWLDAEAGALRKHWDSPELWPRIAGALEVERGRGRRPERKGGWWLGLAAAVALLAAAPAWWYTRQPVVVDPLLDETAWNEVVRSEKAYESALAKLGAQAGPLLERNQTPLGAAWREKLMLVDAALAELRTQSERNPHNRHLQNELLALYRDKQTTLEEVIQHEARTR